MSRSALNKHMKKEHGLNGDEQGNGQIHCKETSCSFKCRHLDQLRQHLVDKHGKKINKEMKTFPCAESKSLPY